MNPASLLVNSHAGGWSDHRARLVQLAEAHGTEIIDCAAESWTSKSWTDIRSRGIRRVIVGGGDGTLSRIFNQAGDHLGDFEWALLPLGTGNDLARSLGLCSDSLEQIWQWALYRPSRPIDLVRLHEHGDPHWIVNGATAGFGGVASSEVTSRDKEHWGATAYWIRAFTQLTTLDTYQIRLDIDGTHEDFSIFALAICNGRTVGGGFPIASEAKLNDGLLDVTVVRSMPSVDAIAAGINLTLGRPPQPHRIRTYRCRRVRVMSDPRLPYSMDGEPVRSLDATFEICPAAIRMVAAPHAPAVSEADI